MKLFQRLREKWRVAILQQLWSPLDQSPTYYTDLQFICRDGSIKCHKMWISSSCSTIGQALAGVHNCVDEFINVIVPDFSINIVQKFLQLFYTGSVDLSSYNELELVKEFGCKQLGLTISLDQLKFSASESTTFRAPSQPKITRLSSKKRGHNVDEAANKGTPYRPMPKSARIIRSVDDLNATHEDQSPVPALKNHGYATPRPSTHGDIDAEDEDSLAIIDEASSAHAEAKESTTGYPDQKDQSTDDLRCTVCSKRFYKHEQMLIHLRRKHKDVLPESARDLLNQTLAQMKETKSPLSERQCINCGKILANKYILKSHMQRCRVMGTHSLPRLLPTVNKILQPEEGES